MAVEGEVARERHQIARGIRQAVEIVLQRAGRRAHDLPVVAQREAAHVAHVHAALERTRQLDHRVLALADPDVVEAGQIAERALDLEGGVGAAHHDRHPLVALAHHLADRVRDVVVERHRGDPDQLRPEALHAALDLVGRGAREQQVEDLDLVPLGAQRGRQIRKRHEQPRELLERVGGVDQQDAHGSSGTALPEAEPMGDPRRPELGRGGVYARAPAASSGEPGAAAPAPRGRRVGKSAPNGAGRAGVEPGRGNYR